VINESRKKNTDWLAALLMRRDSQWLGRAAIICRRLQASIQRRLRQLPRRQRWLKAPIFQSTVVGLALVLAMSRAPIAPAATIVVDGVVCDLVEAIQSANSNTAVGGCAAGSGADTIDLQTDVLLTAAHGYYYYGTTGLPQINSAITIAGNGHTIERESSAPYFRLLAVSNSGNLTLNLVTLTGGKSSQGLASAILSRGTVALHDSEIVENHGENLSGAIVNDNGTLSISNCTISGNYPSAIDTIGELTIIDTQLIANDGQALNLGDGMTTIIRSTIAGNDDSGITNGGGDVTISGSTINNNAGFRGGGLMNWSGTVEINNSTFSGNSSTLGGAIYNRDVLTITNSTITGNTAGAGGGLYNSSNFYCIYTSCFHRYGKVYLARTFVSGNYANEGREIYNRIEFGGVVSSIERNVLGHSGDPGLIGLVPGATDIVPLEPPAKIINGELADNGGPTFTHALPLGSPAIDRASSADCATAPIDSIDQRGQPRNLDGDGNPSEWECDIGAFERQPPEFRWFLPLSTKNNAPPAAGLTP
jgi:predicted outer membrane repeat protein